MPDRTSTQVHRHPSKVSVEERNHVSNHSATERPEIKALSGPREEIIAAVPVCKSILSANFKLVAERAQGVWVEDDGNVFSIAFGVASVPRVVYIRKWSTRLAAG
jgi:hypothetical protein